MSPHPLKNAFAALLHKFASLWVQWSLSWKHLNAKSASKNLNISRKAYLKVTLLLGCIQGVPPPPERCICSTFAQVCKPVGTVVTVMKTFKCKISFQKLKYIKVGLFKSYITFGLHPRCPPTPWKMHLQHFCTSLQPCGHSGQYNETMSIQNQWLNG